MFGKIKKWLLKFPKKMKVVNNDDTVEYRAFEELHQFIEMSAIGWFVSFQNRGTTFTFCKGIEKCINKTVLKQNILDLFRISHSQNAVNGAIIASNDVMQLMLKIF